MKHFILSNIISSIYGRVLITNSKHTVSRIFFLKNILDTACFELVSVKKTLELDLKNS